MKTIAVVDYGMSNLHSVVHALHTLSQASWRVRIVNNADEIDAADKVVFPGQGAARDCMKKLNEVNLGNTLMKAAAEKPFLGICMGMQVLFKHSEENNGTKCLGLFDGEIRHLSKLGTPRTHHKIPHLGWNRVQQKEHHQKEHPMWHKIHDNDYFYFVHSYYAQPADADLISGVCRHGDDFASAIACDRIFAVQFHPEKSANAGLQLLRNFIAWDA